MFDRLVESKNHGKENKKLNELFGATFTLAAIGLIFAFVFSILSFNLDLSDGDLELSSLVAPTIIEEVKSEPQAVEQEKSTEKITSDVPIRQANIQSLEESPVKQPETVSVTPSTQQSRPNVPFKLGDRDFTPTNPNSSANTRETGGGNTSNGITTNTPNILENNEEEPPVMKKPDKKPEKKDILVSRGVVNGQAKYLAQPVYPAAARAVRAEGRVEVQVTIDETGRVISANVISGHTLLRDSALSAARKSTFTPTKLSDQPVKVSGIIVYNFKVQ